MSISLTAYVSAMRSCQPSFLHSNFDMMPMRALLLLPVASVHALYSRLPALPLQPPAGWPYLLGQLAGCTPELRASPSLAALEASMPDRLKAAVAAAAAGEEALSQHDTWWRSADGTLAAYASAPGRPLTLGPRFGQRLAAGLIGNGGNCRDAGLGRFDVAGFQQRDSGRPAFLLVETGLNAGQRFGVLDHVRIDRGGLR
jgi:hypothetical protein